MNYIISDNKVYQSAPPFSEVGEITEGTITILTLSDEPKQRKPRKPREAPLESPAQET